MMKTTPYDWFWKNHWAILPARWRRTFARSSKGNTAPIASGVPLAVTLPIARILVVGTVTAASGGDMAMSAPRFICWYIVSFLSPGLEGCAADWASEPVGLIATSAAAKTLRPASLVRWATPAAIVSSLRGVMTASPWLLVLAHRTAANGPPARRGGRRSSPEPGAPRPRPRGRRARTVPSLACPEPT